MNNKVVYFHLSLRNDPDNPTGQLFLHECATYHNQTCINNLNVTIVGSCRTGWTNNSAINSKHYVGSFHICLCKRRFSVILFSLIVKRHKQCSILYSQNKYFDFIFIYFIVLHVLFIVGVGLGMGL